MQSNCAQLVSGIRVFGSLYRRKLLGKQQQHVSSDDREGHYVVIGIVTSKLGRAFSRTKGLICVERKSKDCNDGEDRKQR